MIAVNITGWRSGFKTISFMKLLREGSQSERKLPEAKVLVDDLLIGKPFTIFFSGRGEAEMFVKDANVLGVISGVAANG
jgi:hypothetical protein